MQLTAKFVKDANPTSKVQLFYDAHKDAPPGFGLVVHPSGGKAFFIRYKQGGKDKRATVGPVSDWSLTAARKEAEEMRQAFAQGRDMKTERRAAVEAEKQARRDAREGLHTLKALCEDYAAHLAAQGKASAREAGNRLRLHVIEGHPDLAKKRAREIVPDDVMTIIRRIVGEGKERTADQVRAYLGAAYRVALRAPYDPRLPAAFKDYGIQADPTAPLAVIPVQTSERVLKRDELKAYLEAIEGDELQARALRLALYAGGQRMAQLLRATASDYDHTTQTLTLLDGKGKRAQPRVHVLPLGPGAAAIVADLIARAEEQTEKGKGAGGSLFASRGAVMHGGEPGKYLRELIADGKCADFNLRDVRRTVETEMARLGIGKDIRAHVLSHGIGGIQDKHYDRHAYEDEKREALRKWERFLGSLKKPAKPSRKVVPLRRAKA